MAMKIQLHVLDFMQAKKINWIEINHFFILFFWWNAENITDLIRSTAVRDKSH